MKKFIYFFVCFCSFITLVSANERKTVELNKCVDGDTAWFYLNDEKIKVRFLAIDTPESTNTIEEYGKEASQYTCSELTNASLIEIEYDDNSNKQDKYNRHLVWIFVDGKLLQEKLVLNGLAEVKYIYGDYKYLDTLYEAQNSSKSKKLNIWSDNDNISNYDIIIIIIVPLVIIILKPKKTTIKKIKRYLK